VLTFKSSNTVYASLSMAILRVFFLVIICCSRSLNKNGFYFYSLRFSSLCTPCQWNDGLFLETHTIL